VLEEFFNVALERLAKPLAKPMSASEAERYLSTVLRPLLAEHSSPALHFEGMRIADSTACRGMTRSSSRRLWRATARGSIAKTASMAGRFKISGLRIVRLMVEIQDLSSSC
jgi:hypothetical protein